MSHRKCPHVSHNRPSCSNCPDPKNPMTPRHPHIRGDGPMSIGTGRPTSHPQPQFSHGPLGQKEGPTPTDQRPQFAPRHTHDGAAVSRPSHPPRPSRPWRGVADAHDECRQWWWEVLHMSLARGLVRPPPHCQARVVPTRKRLVTSTEADWLCLRVWGLGTCAMKCPHLRLWMVLSPAQRPSTHCAECNRWSHLPTQRRNLC